MISIEKLKKLNLFREAPAESLERLGRDMEEKIVQEGEVVCREGETGSVLYLIVSGSVAVEKKLFQEKQTSKIIARLGAEEFFGEMAFIQNLPYSATVTAQEETRLFLLSRPSLQELISKDPKTALDHVFTILTGVSNRLRSTTSELVTVFEIGRAIGLSPSIEELSHKVIGQLSLDLGAGVSIAFYKWNLFNEEYTLVKAGGNQKDSFSPSLEATSALVQNATSGLQTWPDIEKLNWKLEPIPFRKGSLVLSQINMLDTKEGLIIYYCEAAHAFSSGARQLMETVSAVLSPALSTARLREEEESRLRHERNKQQRYSI